MAGSSAFGQYVIDMVCQQAVRYYRVDGEVGSTYTWTLTDPLGVIDTLPETGDTVTIYWDVPVGVYTLATVQHDSITFCDALVEYGTIEVFESPTAYAGLDDYICKPDPYTLVNSSVTNASTLLWTTSGDGNFDDPTTLHPVYTFGANDILAGTVTLTITAQGLGYSGSCPPAESLVIITLGNLLVSDSITPASCPVVSDGNITFYVSGGLEPYTFIFNGNTNTTGYFDNLAPGDYSYDISDSQGCSVQGTVTIGTLPVLSAEAIFVDESYPGAANGSITVINQSGGSGVYEYALDPSGPWQSSPTFTGLSVGFYDVYMRDANAPECWIWIRRGEIGTSDPLTAQYIVTDATCYGLNDGTITFFDPMNGSGFYEYSIDWGATWQSDSIFTGLYAGNYNLIIRDSLLPVNKTVLGDVTINQPAQLTATVTVVHESTPGADDGEIHVNAPSGGSGSYEYSIDNVNWQSSPDFTGLAPGIYEVWMRDANATYCVVLLDTVEIIAAEALNAVVAYTNIDCYDAANGTITISGATGASGNYEYSIDGGVTWTGNSTFTGLAPGTYVVMIRDEDNPSNFTILETVVITQPDILNAEVTHTNDTCDMDGTITVHNPTGGSGSYEYSINGFIWQSDSTFTGLFAAFYNVYVRDSLVPSCVMDVADVWILNTCALTATIDTVPISCYGAADGYITLSNPQGGSGDYEYSIDGGLTWQSSGSFGPLGPGTYVVMMREEGTIGTEVTLDTIILSDPAQLAGTVIVGNETYTGMNDGTLEVSAPTGGSGDFDYSLDGITWQPDSSFTGLAPGIYSIWMRDANNTDCYVILGPFEILPGGVLTADSLFTNITCFGANDGTITFTNPQGGTGVYEYSIDNGVTWQADPKFTGLAPGTYTLVMRDLNIPEHFVVVGTITLTEPAVLYAEIQPVMIGCDGGTTGSITFANVSGGSGSYGYSIDNGVTWQSSPVFAGLAAGTYYPVIRDAAATYCYIPFAPVEITAAVPITVTTRTTEETCGLANGTIYILATGGTGVFEYQLVGDPVWQSGNIIDSLAAGSYYVLVRDDGGCETSYGPVDVPGTPGVVITAVNITHTTNGQATGTAEVIASSPALPIEYSLDSITWQLSNTFNDLPAGSYTVWARDANGCIDKYDFSIGNIVLGVIELVSGRVTDCVGEIRLLDALVYEFDSITSFTVRVSFDPAIFEVMGVVNINNNLIANNVTTTIVSPGVMDISYTDPGFVSLPDGDLLFNLQIRGIAPGLTQFEWEWIECVVMSPIGYVTPVTLVVNGYAEVFANPDLLAWEDGEFCEGDSTILHASTTMEEVVFTWTHPRGIQHMGDTWDLNPLSVMDSGNYVVEARKEDQCYTIDTVNIVVFPAPEVDINYSDTICFGNPVILDPGKTFVKYEWSTGSTMQNIIAYEAGIYWLKVEDFNGCSAIDTAFLEPCIIEILVPNAFTPNGDGLNDDFEPIFRGFEPAAYRMDIYSKWGQLIYTTTTLGRGWDGRVNGELVSPDTFVYVISYEVPSFVLRKGLTSPITGRVTVLR